jgi:hypothetical protein
MRVARSTAPQRVAARISKESVVDESLQLTDLGDAMVETKQVSPFPPQYQDWIYGLGSWSD